MLITLKYNFQKISISFPFTPTIIGFKQPQKTVNKRAFLVSFRKLLKERNLDKIAIVIADKTRTCEYKKYLPWIIDAINEFNVPKERITFFIAYGTHPKQTREESLQTYGKIYEKYEFVHHDSNNLSLFKNIGRTKRGTPILIRKDILDSSTIITFGQIQHHYFAGFGGGRKLLFPGLGEKYSIYRNHSLFLDSNNKTLNIACMPGQLINNPVAEDLKEISLASPSVISINAILNDKNQVAQLHIDTNYSDFLSTCKIYDSYYKIKDEKEYDCVVASAGGYPKDINFIQTHKSINNAARFVKDGGTLFILAGCKDGIGNKQFLSLFKNNYQDLFTKLLQKYQGNGGTALSMMEKTKRINILMYTSLKEKQCQLLGVKKITKKQLIEKINQVKSKVAVIPSANLVIR